MGQSVFPAPSAASKTRYVETLTSGTSWTVPAGVEYVNAKLVGGGGGGGGPSSEAAGGEIQETNVTTTPGDSIAYAIGAGGAANTVGGNTTFTGATTALGGNPTLANTTYAGGPIGTNGISAGNGGGAALGNGGGPGSAGGNGQIILEYWK
jgi:hypothetical protein